MIGSIRRIAGNALSILVSDVTDRAATFVLYALVARYLGAFEFGQMSLGITFFQTFQLLAIAGMQILVTREIANDKGKTAIYLVNGSLIVTAFSLTSILTMVMIIKMMSYSLDTSRIILLFSLGLLPYSLSVICDAVFQAWERMHFITYANTVANIVKIGLASLLLTQGYDLTYLVLVILFSYTAILAMKWWLLLTNIGRPKAKFDLNFSLTMIKSTITFFGMNGLYAIMSSLTIILLSRLTTEVEVGLFSAANQLMVPVSLIFQSVNISVFPVMCRSYEPSYQRLRQISEHLFEILLAITLPAAVGLFVLAEAILLFLYGDRDFLGAAGVLRIMVGVLILKMFTHTLGRVLVASLREHIVLWILFIDLLATIIMAPILISQFGLKGAAISILLVRVIDFVQHYIPVSHSFSQINIGPVAWKPIVASVVMIAYLMMVRDQHLLLTIASAAILYFLVLLALTVWSVGGPTQLKIRYLYLWTK